ncbi:ABC transporter permease [Desertimonas flava]|uniref:ABC transporter permease n=1 Tax=Desertimonas flava TaxID=2064846 RepID=UPI000E3533DD|nr:ABC transporter permease [Desertimonas flava]
MIDSLRSEWIKLSTLTVVKVLAIVAVAFPVIVVALVSALSDDIVTSKDLIDLINVVAVLSAMLVGVVAAIGMTNEFNHGTIRPTFAAQPRRLQPLLAKLLVHLAFAAVLMLIVLAVSWLLGVGLSDAPSDNFPLREFNGFPVPALAALAGAGLLGVGLTMLGFGLGMLIRNTPATVSVLLLWPLVAEGLVAALLSALDNDEAVRFLPYVEGINMASWNPGTDDLMGRVPGGIYFFVWVAAITVLGLWRTNRSDA